MVEPDLRRSRGRRGDQRAAKPLLFAVEALPQLLQQKRVRLAVLRTYGGGLHVRVPGVLPVDVHAIETVLFYGRNSRVDEPATALRRDGHIGEAGRSHASAAHRDQDLQLRILLAQRRQYSQVRCIVLAAFCNDAILQTE